MVFLKTHLELYLIRSFCITIFCRCFGATRTTSVHIKGSVHKLFVAVVTVHSIHHHRFTAQHLPHIRFGGEIRFQQTDGTFFHLGQNKGIHYQPDDNTDDIQHYYRNHQEWWQLFLRLALGRCLRDIVAVVDNLPGRNCAPFRQIHPVTGRRASPTN